MKFLPYENFYLVTPLKPAEVQERLEQNTQAAPGFSFSSMFSQSYDACFSGYVINATFEFKRNINYRNSFLPLISGSTEAWPGGSRVHVKMRLNTAVMIFMCVWLGGVGLACAGVIASGVSDKHFEPAALIPFGMFLFGYALATGGFKYESNKAKTLLLGILGGQIEP
jgi:hypothetical protein